MQRTLGASLGHSSMSTSPSEVFRITYAYLSVLIQYCSVSMNLQCMQPLYQTPTFPLVGGSVL